jgi:hypothetical protein
MPHRINGFMLMNYAIFILIDVIMLYPFWHVFIGSMIGFDEYSKYKILLFP